MAPWSPDFEKQAKEAFIDNQFELAVHLYTQAIALDPENFKLFSDRAQANIKSNNFNEAEAYASHAISLNSAHYQSHLRRGVARMKLGNYMLAKEGLLQASYTVPNDSK